MSDGRKTTELIERARRVQMTPEQLEAQRRSFAFGNVALENPNVTREMVDRAADRIKPPPAK